MFCKKKRKEKKIRLMFSWQSIALVERNKQITLGVTLYMFIIVNYTDVKCKTNNR